jgi:hypothetical protein
MDTRHRAGAALPGVLLVMFWLTGISGWLVAHTIWDQRVARVDETTLALGHAADAMGDVMAGELGRLADWSTWRAPGPALPCPAGTVALPAEIDVMAETSRLAAATAVLSRWPGTLAPTWRYLTACDASTLQGLWRGRSTAPWLLAWIADDPDSGPAADSSSQMVLHIAAIQPGRGRADRTLTVRRYQGEATARIVAWRPG